MADIDLSQSEADALISMEKHRISDEQYSCPVGGSLIVPLQSADKREQFLLDISRGRINLSKGKYQSRARQVVVLVRLDFGGAPHRNPDDKEVPCPHLHIYREGFGDKWATPLPNARFLRITDARDLLEDFMKFCTITHQPNIDLGLFV